MYSEAVLNILWTPLLLRILKFVLRVQENQLQINPEVELLGQRVYPYSVLEDNDIFPR